MQLQRCEPNRIYILREETSIFFCLLSAISRLSWWTHYPVINWVSFSIFFDLKKITTNESISERKKNTQIRLNLNDRPRHKYNCLCLCSSSTLTNHKFCTILKLGHILFGLKIDVFTWTERKDSKMISFQFIRQCFFFSLHSKCCLRNSKLERYAADFTTPDQWETDRVGVCVCPEIMLRLLI